MKKWYEPKKAHPVAISSQRDGPDLKASLFDRGESDLKSNKERQRNSWEDMLVDSRNREGEARAKSDQEGEEEAEVLTETWRERLGAHCHATCYDNKLHDGDISIISLP
ncbi:hypothetical protein PHYBLDRAFT_65735 [Phycomyces blakesleeanus NRRL 1555(-)]|uniref:Uncharacterized protein n=1 Tax=Phycomyces blakesleeanus (strain ATCC 8743b / DSM 1359 / FGSC 10004 / NBRC 33097 / NRRL 1555) TaxID=763407 RepID=A0A162PID6_PHYB8|nr:hypothetical protein PHYBLDRAFT_65735 [Phycomyces blakesleeanus NRRL 1555(-)]OAD73137.1 hypothetical protein PHYBLDRAFT_65735 [Phycomyces blakesleeanus NRRL 1555(-)]|eukprot:XP_018291177.1 hypothetical protein PHYBLDRAFT_65735 [Phycomyces blakesleeanus NRRL 1555(-)]